MRRTISVVAGSIIATLVVAPRFSAVTLVILGVLILADALRQKRMPVNIEIVDLLLVTFVVWTAMSLAWSPQEVGDIASVLKICVLISAGLVVVRSNVDVSWPASYAVYRIVVYGVGVGLAVVVIAALYAELTGTSLWGSYYFDPLTTLNSSAVVIALLIWPCAVIVVRQQLRRSAMFALAIIALLVYLPSAAALCAVFVGALTMFCRRYLGRKMGIFIALSASLLLFAAPQIVKLSGADAYSDSRAVNDMASSVPYSTRHRLAIWSFAVEKIEEKPWLGWGFHGSRSLPQEDRRLAPNMEIMPLHPHSLALQTRLELGLPGAIILAGLVFAVFYRLATFTDDGWKSGLAMAAGSSWFFIANVSYGMWQSWWIALAFLLAVLMKVALAAKSGEACEA